MAESIAIKIAIIGAGKGGSGLLECFSEIPNIIIIGIADKNPGAPGLKQAIVGGIPITTDPMDLISREDVDLILDATGDSDISSLILRQKKKKAKLFSGAEAKLLWQLVQNVTRQNQQIRSLMDHINEAKVLLEQNVLDRTNDLTLINQVALTVNRSLDLEAILNDVLILISDWMNADAGHIGVIGKRRPFTKEAEAFSAEAWLGVPENVINCWRGSAKKTMQLDRPLTIDPKTAAPDGTFLPLLHPLYKEVISVPIEEGDGSLGILSLARWTSIPFPPHAVDLLISVGRPIGMAIRNAQLFQEVQQVDHLKTELMSNISHEIRTPLTSILGYAELLQEFNLDHRVHQKYLSIISQEGKRLTDLLNDLLDLSKLSSGKIEWVIKPVDLQPLIAYAMNLMQPLAEQKGLTFRIEMLPDIPSVLGDEEHLQQVINNLLSNALKFTSSGEVVIGAEQQGNRVTVYVQDTGIGIQPGDQEKIFEKFYQITATPEGKPKGTGLGLAICREILSHLGGKIWCESVPGLGSTFYFTLPVEKPSPNKKNVDP